MWSIDTENIENRVKRKPTPFEVAAFVLLLLIARAITISGEIYALDFRSYLAAARGEQFALGYYYPYYVLPVFNILDLLPYQTAYYVWTVINILGMLLAVRIFGGHALLGVVNFLSFIAIGEGQITGVIFAAVALMWWATQRRWVYLASIASVFVVIKYSYGSVIALVLLLHPDFSWKERVKILIIPATVVAISIMIWGLWPLEQIEKLSTNPPVTSGSVVLWQSIGPFALLFWLPVVLMNWSPQKRFLLVLVTIPLGLPYLLRQDMQLMFLPMYYYAVLSNLLIPLMVFFGTYATRVFVVVPLAIYTYMVIRGIMDPTYLKWEPGARQSTTTTRDLDATVASGNF